MALLSRLREARFICMDAVTAQELITFMRQCDHAVSAQMVEWQPLMRQMALVFSEYQQKNDAADEMYQVNQTLLEDATKLHSKMAEAVEETSLNAAFIRSIMMQASIYQLDGAIMRKYSSATFPLRSASPDSTEDDQAQPRNDEPKNKKNKPNPNDKETESFLITGNDSDADDEDSETTPRAAAVE